VHSNRRGGSVPHLWPLDPTAGIQEGLAYADASPSLRTQFLPCAFAR
jgi:hypothetical protein